MKQRILGMFAAFLVVMLLFTVVSRAADSMSIAKVTTARPQQSKIAHKVTGSGKVQQNREQAVSTLPGQTVKTIYVEEGRKVTKGELLFEIDLEELKEQILEQKQEMKKEELLSRDKASSRETEAQKEALNKSRAAQDYNIAASKANTAVNRAWQEWKSAESKLNALSSGDAVIGGGDAVEDVLEKAIEQKKEEYEQAVKDKEELKKAIDNAVEKALQDLKNDRATEITAEPVMEQMQAETGSLAFGGDAGTVWEDDILLPEAGPADAVDVFGSGNGSIWGAETDSAASGESSYGGAADQGSISVPEIPSQTTDSWLVEQQIRKENQPLLDEAEQLIVTKETEVRQAEAALTDYRQTKAAGEQQSAEEMQAQLQEEVSAKRQAYEDAASAAEESVRTAGRSVEDAGLSEASDSTAEIDAITREQAELKLQKLEKLLEEEGKITAPVDGTITKVNILTGEKTPDGTALLMSDTASGNKLVVQVPADQEKYVARGDSAVVNQDGRDKKWKDLTVDSVRVNEEDTDLLDVTVQLPKDSLEAGMAAVLEASRSSELFDFCIPIQALYEESGKNFVYVLEESESVLGKEMTARRVDVTVVDKNDTLAALAAGAISRDQQVIQSSDKVLSGGSRVRLAEE